MPKQGDIVLVPFPFTDLSSSKVRPALVLSSGSLGNDVVVVFISSQRSKRKHDVSVVPSKVNGLKARSVIVCSKIATLEKTVSLGGIGSNEKEVLEQVKDKLKALFNV